MNLPVRRGTWPRRTELMIFYVEDEGKEKGEYLRVQAPFGLDAIVAEPEDEDVEQQHCEVQQKCYL